MEKWEQEDEKDEKWDEELKYAPIFFSCSFRDKQ